MAQIIHSLKHGAASPEQIASLEIRIGAELPQDYKEFLGNHNGGSPSPNAFFFVNDFGDEEEDAVECFFPLRDADCRQFENMAFDELPDWPVHCAWEDLQRDLRDLYETKLDYPLLPIGTDGSSNYICLVLDGEQRGSVAFFEHEMAQVSILASSFSAFLTGLRERQDGG